MLKLNQNNCAICYNEIKRERGEKMYREAFAQKLKKAREDTGFTQREVTAETRIPQSTLANYEVGRTEPDIETIGILADFYGIDLNWLFGTKGKQEY